MKKAITFFISQAITLFGSQIVAFAIIWYITIETSSGLWVALLTICSFVPQFLCSFIGGALLVLTIVLGVVVLNCLRIARANPVESLKAE